ncbi:MAG: hypothetical protein SF029_20555 [bacterium]|nr:hypothetical protein [bacterium]
MFDVLRTHPLKALVVLVIPALAAVVYLAATLDLVRQENDGQIGAVLDDTWIHVRFAAQIAQGEGLSYNEGVLTTGATSPLWVLLLAAVFRLTTPDVMSQVNTAIFMSAAGHVLCVLATAGCGYFISRRAWVGLLAGLLVALTGRLVWMGLSGMEITTFAALCVLALWSHVDDVRRGRSFGWRTGILAALATLGRPEGYLLAGLIWLESVLSNRTVKTLWEKGWATWRGVLAYGLLAGSYPLVCLLISGYPLPNTFRVKSMLGREWPNLPFAFFWQPREDFGWLLIVLAGVGLVALVVWARQTQRLRRAEQVHTDLPWRNGTGKVPITPAVLRNAGWVFPLWPLLFVTAVLFMGADRYVVNHSRYVAPAIPFYVLLASVGVLALGESLQQLAVSPPSTPRPPSPSGRRGSVPSLRERFGVRAASHNRTNPETKTSWRWRFIALRPGGSISFLAALLLLASVLFYGREEPAQVANDVLQLRTMHVAAGEWLRGAIPDGATVALNDVGAITHLSDKRVLDLEGLVSAEVIEATRDTERFSCSRDLALMRLMVEQRPALVGIFPWWYPCMAGWPGALQAEIVFSITGPTVIAGGEMVFYRPQWEAWPLQSALPPEAIPIEADFEQEIRLVGYETEAVEGGLLVTLWWRATGQPEGDYTVFVHLNDASGEIISQHDRAPQDGRFATSLWREGDLLWDAHLIPLEPGFDVEQDGLFLRVGLYPPGGPNLPRLTAPIDQPDSVILPLP